MPRKKKTQPEPARTPTITGGMPRAAGALLEEKERMIETYQPAPAVEISEIMVALSEIMTGMRTLAEEVTRLREREREREEQALQEQRMIDEMRRAVEAISLSVSPNERARAEAKIASEVQQYTGQRALNASRIATIQQIESEPRIPFYWHGEPFQMSINGVSWNINSGYNEVPRTIFSHLEEMNVHLRESQERHTVLGSNYPHHVVDIKFREIDKKYGIRSPQPGDIAEAQAIARTHLR